MRKILEIRGILRRFIKYPETTVFAHEKDEKTAEIEIFLKILGSFSRLRFDRECSIIPCDKVREICTKVAQYAPV